MIWSLFGGLAALAEKYSYRDLIETANFRRMSYFIFSALAWFATVSGKRIPEPFAFLGIIGSLAACMLLLHLIYTFHHELGSTHVMQEQFDKNGVTR